MRLCRSKPLGPAVVEDLMIESSRPNCPVELAHSRVELLRGQFEFCRKIRNRRCRDCREYGWHEAADHFRINDGIRDLVLLLRYQPSPNGVALRPQIFAFV